VTFFLNSQAVEASQNVTNVTAYLDGEEMNFTVDEDAGPGNSPWIAFEVNHFSTRTVSFASGTPETVPAVGSNRPQDPDSDGLYQDVDGDGDVGVSDVQLLYESLDDPAVQEHDSSFDFSGDGAVTYDDVRLLLDQVRAETGADYSHAVIYVDQNGVVTTQGLTDGIDRWQNGDIDTDELREVIDAWQTGGPVV